MSSRLTLDRLQPALLDRLSNVPRKGQPDPAQQRGIDERAFRAAVLRDLGWLLNCTRPTDITWKNRPQACRSVLNYGVPPLAGQIGASYDPAALGAAVRQAILDFEPRIERESLRVDVQVSDSQLSRHNVIGLTISGKVQAVPEPLYLLLNTEMDLETGEVTVRESN